MIELKGRRSLSVNELLNLRGFARVAWCPRGLVLVIGGEGGEED